MTIQEAYKRFNLKLNKNDSGANVRIPEAVFILTYNEQALRWLSDKLISKQPTDSIDDLEDLLETEELVPATVKEKEVSSELPENFFRFVNCTVQAATSQCSRVLYVHRISPKSKNVYLQDAFTKPSFDWEETLATVGSRKLTVYREGFDINYINLEYYKKPAPVDIEGYIGLDNLPSRNVHPDLSDSAVNEIINRCVVETIRSIENPNGFQLAEHRVQTEK